MTNAMKLSIRNGAIVAIYMVLIALIGKYYSGDLAVGILAITLVSGYVVHMSHFYYTRIRR